MSPKLNDVERAELLELLSSCGPSEFAVLFGRGTAPRVNRLLRHYVPLPKDEVFEIWSKQKELAGVATDIGLADDERVEDAGLEHDDAEDWASPGELPESVGA